jgi:hypothetical protein
MAPTEKPTIVCLCGSTRFWREFQKASLRETLAGNIVLSIGAASGTDDEHFGNLSREEYDRIKEMLDRLHLRKIDLADEVLVLNVGGYIGDSTSKEIIYAIKSGKLVRWLQMPDDYTLSRLLALGDVDRTPESFYETLEPVEANLAREHDEAIAVAEQMKKFGGSFVQALGELIYRADPINKRIIKREFVQYWNQYLGLARPVQKEEL